MFAYILKSVFSTHFAWSHHIYIPNPFLYKFLLRNNIMLRLVLLWFMHIIILIPFLYLSVFRIILKLHILVNYGVLYNTCYTFQIGIIASFICYSMQLFLLLSLQTNYYCYHFINYIIYISFNCNCMIEMETIKWMKKIANKTLCRQPWENNLGKFIEKEFQFNNVHSSGQLVVYLSLSQLRVD